MPNQNDIELDLTDTHIILKIPLHSEPILARSGKCHIVAQTTTWHKSIHKINNLTIQVPPLTIIAK